MLLCWFWDQCVNSWCLIKRNQICYWRTGQCGGTTGRVNLSWISWEGLNNVSHMVDSDNPELLELLRDNASYAFRCVHIPFLACCTQIFHLQLQFTLGIQEYRGSSNTWVCGVSVFRGARIAAWLLLQWSELNRWFELMALRLGNYEVIKDVSILYRWSSVLHWHWPKP